MISRALAFTIAVCAACSVMAGAQGSTPLDNAFADFWKADDARETGKASEKILKTGVGFDAIYARLKKGREYKPAKAGETILRYPAGSGVSFENVVSIPPEYEPSKPMQVRVQLHGGVNRPGPWMQRRELQAPGGVGAGEPDGESLSAEGGMRMSMASRRGPNRIPGEPQIVIEPSGWIDAQWWQTSQVDNILRTLDAVKRRWNVDESRVYFTGISDGGTAAYFMAMRDTTPWSTFLPLNGSIAVLRGIGTGSQGQLHASNLVNKPFYIVNGENDPLYPVADVATHVQWFEMLGMPFVFRPQKFAGHDVRWWPEERVSFEAFVREHPRVPHPQHLSWETERTDKFNRAHWLVIEKIGPGEGDAPLEQAGFFPHRTVSGRVDARRLGNTFEIESRDVREFRLLLSPDVIDFGAPVIVNVNGKMLFEGTVQKNPAVLLAWAARDQDRTMLYAAELPILVR